MKHMKKSILLIAFVLFALSVCPYGCGSKSGTFSVFLYEESENGTITITGLTDYGKGQSTITIPAGIDDKPVRIIASEAFRDDTVLQKVVIEDGITTISSCAFFGCMNLNEVTIPLSVTSVSPHAFENTAWQKQMIQENGALIINNILVETDASKSSYAIPDGVTCIASGAFYNHKSITGVTLPSSLTMIGTYAFSGCENLTEITLPSGIQKIGYGAFADCGVSEITVPEGVKIVEPEAFLNIPHIIYEGDIKDAPWGALTMN